ncbi:MAG: aspartate/glutamate racemase family protein [Candidatus Aminicenantes bacterium]|nr:MAG: aspartate/glutamate racemase family protein [Candidatus Aminicenantes bacterium]
MKILIINPNSDLEMTKDIQETAEKFAREHFEVLCLPTPGAPKFIETREDEVLAAPGMIKLAKENNDKCDAFIIACHCDPNIDVINEITDKPVVGIGEASMRIASILGHRFSIIQTTKESVPLKEDLVRKYQLQDSLASVRAPQEIPPESSDEERYIEAARAAIAEDRADVIVLGCAGLTGLAKRMQQELGIPVMDGVICALILATALI